jgi:tRNA threonylcarbamoyladenosine modification (KEOPS) complex Cgi121 subunit
VVEISAAVVRCYLVGKGDPTGVINGIRSLHPRLIVQGLSDKAATNESFVEMIAAQTLYASATANLLAKKPEIDFLLRIAGTTQITTAISKMGAKKGEPFLLAVAGEGRSVAELKAPSEWSRLPRTDLSERESARIEKAALLNAAKG